MFRGPLTILIIRLGTVGILYTLTRLLFSWSNSDLFPHVEALSYVGGMRFDAFAIAWVNLPWLLLFLIDPRPSQRWFRMLQRSLFTGLNAVALFFQFVDVEYYRFTLKRSTADLYGIMSTGNDTVNIAPAILRDYWHLLLLLLACIVALYFVHRSTEHTERVASPLYVRIGWRVLAVAGFLVASRGGLQLIPLQVLDAAQYGGAENLPVTLNTPYTLMISVGKSTLKERVYMSTADADLLWPVYHHYPEHAIGAPRTNVALIILESFSAAYSARLSGEAGYMPFLDSLMGESMNMTTAYANGRRSIDGIPAILASIPELMDEGFITSSYAALPFTSLANTLTEVGYSTSFFHGGRNGTMGFDGFTRSAGFADYYGLNEYTGPATDFDGHWGIRDTPYLQYWARSLSEQREPYFSTVFTLSSHHPYAIPPGDAERFAGGTQDIHPTLRYTDDALRQFFATARTMPWYANTLFVITADHTADIDRSGQQYTKATDYWIPLLYFQPGVVVPEARERVTQHIDILPTVLDLIGYGKPFFSFGHSALRPASPPYAITSSNSIYQCFGENFHLLFDGEKVLGHTALNGAESGPFGEPDELVIYDMSVRLQAAIQQYNSHLIRGELVIR